MMSDIDFNSCSQFVADLNLLSSIDNIYQDELVSDSLFDILSPPQTYIVSCSDNNDIVALSTTHFTVQCSTNSTIPVSLFYKNSLKKTQELYPSYSLIYTNQNLKIEQYEQSLSQTSAFNVSNFYTTTDPILSMFTSYFMPHEYVENETKAFEVWKLQWWLVWNEWKIVGVAAFGAICCLICCVVCYKCRRLKCICTFEDSNEYKSRRLPTQDTNDDNDNDDDDEVINDTDCPKSNSNDINQVGLASNNKPNPELVPIKLINGSDTADTDGDSLYEDPNKISIREHGRNETIPGSNWSATIGYLTNLSTNTINHHMHKAHNETVSELKKNEKTNEVILEIESNRTPNNSISIPPIPASPDDGFEGNSPILPIQNQVSRASNECLSAENKSDSYNQENKYNESIDPQNHAKFSNNNYKPISTHSRCSSKCNFSVSCVEFNDDFKINIDDYQCKQVLDWFVKDVCLRNQDTVNYFNIFIDNGFDTIDAVADMQYNDLGAIGINKRGHVKRLGQAISKLKAKSAQNLSPPTHKYCDSNSSITHEYPSQLSGINESNLN